MVNSASTVLILLLIWCSSSPAVISLGMTDFEIHECQPSNHCLMLKGPKAYLSKSMNGLSASEAQIEIYVFRKNLNQKSNQNTSQNSNQVDRKLQKENSQVFSCHSLSYRFDTKLLLCDNSLDSKYSSVLVDASLNITYLKQPSENIKN
ncbi:MAG: hypothetical protein J0M15_14610 [Deltaproteobacteria bacterium]|jgi:hypothetical protein|nr:hypothetical protein [Deltaproteobacteria bacterium]